MSDTRPIGVFDSGVGGLSVWREIRRILPHEDTIYFADQAHVPYGPRGESEIRHFCDRITRFLLAQDCKAVVVACNTASAAALKYLRETFPDLPSIGMEPAVKPAAEFTRTDNNASETVYNVIQNAVDKKVTLSVNFFDSDFGILRVINGNPKCMPAATRGYVLQPSYVEIATLLPMGTTRLEDQGGGPRGFIDSMETLVCKDPRAHGKIAY